MRLLGFAIEDLAKSYLEENGLTLISQNFHSRFGEIDLIMQHQQTLCFIEVRHRKTTTYGSAAESITPSKQQKIRKTALFFLQKNNQYNGLNMRFDAMLSQGKQKEVNFEWIKNAF
ncbi:MAG: YraN family protein [Gammaproteobacteria bacterium]|nr:YraN family protein [Gammaproteobacteria bacterium]